MTGYRPLRTTLFRKSSASFRVREGAPISCCSPSVPSALGARPSRGGGIAVGTGAIGQRFGEMGAAEGFGTGEIGQGARHP